jgi:hypothetical protein
MPAKPSGEIKTRIVNSVQKNGDTYVLERQTIYDKDKKHNKILSTKLLSKIPKGTENPAPTRPKKSKTTKIGDSPTDKSASERNIAAEGTRIGMMCIIDHLGAVSSIDDALYSNTDIGTAQKIIGDIQDNS